MRASRPFRLVSPYDKWKKAHPGEEISHVAWLSIQVDATRRLLRRLEKELAEEQNKTE